MTVVDGLGNKYEKYIGATTGGLNLASFDNVEPTPPTISTTNGLDLNVTFADADTQKVYMFETAVPEDYSTNDELANYSVSTAGINICSKMSAVTISSAAGRLVAIAVDGDGTIGGGNASDQSYIAYMPILKSRVYMTNTNNGTKTETNSGPDYNSTCESSANLSAPGIEISAITDNTTAKIAFTKYADTDLTGAPLHTIYLSDGTTVVEVQYADEFIGRTSPGSEIFVMIDGKTYTHTLTTEPAAGEDGSSDNTPLDISSSIKTGVTF